MKTYNILSIDEFKKVIDDKSILLGIDVEFSQIYKVIEIGINDTQTTIAIIDFEVNLPLEESLFVFDKEKYFFAINHFKKQEISPTFLCSKFKSKY